MQSHRVVQWARQWKDVSLINPRSRDEALLERLNDTDDASTNDVDREKNDNGNGDEKTTEKRNSFPWLKSRQQRLALTSIATLSLVLLVTLILRNLNPPPAPSPSPELYHCGNSTLEARALGCEFDILSYSWTPRACHERGTATEFRSWLQQADRRFGAFPFFYDAEATQRVPDEHALSESHGRSIFTTQEEHLGHCTFLMRRWHRLANQRERSRHVNHRFGKYVHTKHCTDRILNALADPGVLGETRLDSRFGVTFERC